ncbi:hypothetical protein ACFLT2_07765 [Acidobacteriota bacterium]
MKKSVALISLVIFILASSAGIGYAGKGIEGVWEGTIEVQGTSLGVTIKVSKDADGALSATIDIPDQGAVDLPLNNVTFEDNTFKFDLIDANGSYEGKLKESGDDIEGEWSQGGGSIPLNLKRTG